MFFACLVLLVVSADQLTKWWISSHLSRGEVLWDAGLLQIVRVYNTGAAFGVFQGHSLFLLAVDIIGIVAMLFILFFLRRRWPFLRSLPVISGVAFVIAGTVGNLIDRIRFGGVTDFIDFKVWPVFNVADSSVTIGCIVLAVYIIFSAGRAKKDA
ncbi:MAG: signal peptidase II [Chloroflexi bacterium RBG_16_56_11]|nr:MAG: signal peptidase II [Chloroflexi bacterium RBG_16_56_11]